MHSIGFIRCLVLPLAAAGIAHGNSILIHRLKCGPSAQSQSGLLR